MPHIDFRHLSPQERIELATELLDSIQDGDIPLSAERRAELDRRNAAYDEGRAILVPWDEVRAEMRAVCEGKGKGKGKGKS